MKRNTITLLTLALVLLSVTACNKEDPKVIELEQKLEQMEAERLAEEEAERLEAELEAELEEAEEEAEEEAKDQAEKAQLKAELEASKAAEKAAKDAAAKEKAEAKAAANKFGPGNANNLEGWADGWVRVHTRSANGKLSLRTMPDQGSSTIITIPNGTDDIYYFYRVKVGEYVWYEVNYNGNVGYLRGDYLHRY